MPVVLDTGYIKWKPGDLMPRFSVIIPAWNRAVTLERAIRSALSQSRKDLEILVGDDGSDDDTVSMAEALREEDKRVRVFSWRPNRGVSATRNRLIRKSDSDFICLLDSDDAWLPEKLEIQADALERNPEAGCCHTGELWYRGEKQVTPPSGYLRHREDPFLFNLKRCTISPSSSVIRRTLLEKHGVFDEALFACEDQDLWLRLAPHTFFHSIRTPLTRRYGGRKDQLSIIQWGLDRFRIAVLLKIEENVLPDRYRKALRETIREKSRILAAGYRKRGKTIQAEMYNKLAEQYEGQSDF